MLETRQLEYFLALAETLHFGRAAARVHITQPALSQQIRKLEAQLGVSLVERTSRTVALTDAGTVFREEAERALAQVARAAAQAQAVGRGEAGRLRVGFVGSVMSTFLPAAIRAFRSRHPGVTLELQECNTYRQQALIGQGEMDLGFLFGGPDDRTLTYERIYSHALVVAMPAAHPLAGRTAISLLELAGEPFVMVSREHEPGLYDRHIGAFQQAGFVPDVVQDANQFQTILGLVAAGIGVCPMAAYVRQVVYEGVAFVPVSEPDTRIDLCAAWRTSTALVRRFMEVVRTVAAT